MESITGQGQAAIFAVTMPSDREVCVTTYVTAPRPIVFDAYTKPEIARRWFYGPADWPLVECAVDLRVGGALRYVWEHTDQGKMGMSGLYREVVPSARLVHTELFDEDWTGGETIVTTLFEDQGRATKVTITVLYSSPAARDAALATDMLNGWRQLCERLENLAPELAASTG